MIITIQNYQDFLVVCQQECKYSLFQHMAVTERVNYVFKTMFLINYVILTLIIYFKAVRFKRNM